jgi:hypothetical protein
MGISVSFQMGVSVKRSVPALKRWINLRFLASLTSTGREDRVTRIVACSHHSRGMLVLIDQEMEETVEYHLGRF